MGLMASKKIVLSLFAALLGLTALANAISLSGSIDSASISCRDGKAFYWVANDDGAERLVSFTAQFQDLNGYFETPFGRAPPNAGAGSYLVFNAPENMRGSEDVLVKASVCTLDGRDCITRTAILRVFVSPCREANYYINGTASLPGSAYVPAYSYSGLQTHGYFDPTYFAAEFTGGDRGCVSLKPGESARVPTSLVNEGAAGSFALRLGGDKNKLNAVISNEYVSLNRNNEQNVFIDVAPSRLQGAGRYWVTAQAYHDNVLVAEKDFCVDVVESYEAELVLPSSVSVRACGETSFDVLIRNKGTQADSYDIALPQYAYASPTTVTLQPGEEKRFSITVDGSLLSGTRTLVVEAKNSASVEPKTFSARTVLETVQCGFGPSPQPSGAGGTAATSVSKEEQEELIKIVVGVSNPGDAPLEDVTAEVTGLPSSWTVSAPSGVTIPANSEKQIVLFVNRKSGEEAANASVLVKSGGKTIAVKELPKIEARDGGLTGFFVAAASQNIWLIAFLILFAFIVVVLLSRTTTEPTAGGGSGYDYVSESIKAAGFHEPKPEPETEAYKERLKALKNEIDRMHGEGVA